ncbi:MAG: hypothetical protein JHD16_08055 [Solirubrobacteraceae bacterium]|nr:hypothetical protein [Solirubrobacteraceae bacterium]
MRATPSRRWAATTYVTACAAFAGALGVLAAQVQAGNDPVIGASAAPPTATRPKIVVTRKIVRTTVVTTRVIRKPKPVAVAPAPAGQGYVAAAQSTVAAPAVSSAPAAAAPAPVASAPAPAPAPAAPVTRAS